MSNYFINISRGSEKKVSEIEIEVIIVSRDKKIMLPLWTALVEFSEIYCPGNVLNRFILSNVTARMSEFLRYY